MKTNFFYRLTSLVGFFSVLLALGSAYYMQYEMLLEPCPMCMLQRIVFVLLGVWFLLAWLFVPGNVGRRFWAVLIVAIGTVGLYLAWRHLEIMQTPKEDLLSSCSSLGIATEREFWMSFFDFPGMVIREAIAGGETCASEQYFLGVLIPVWALIGYGGLMVVALVGAIPNAPRRWLS